MSEVLLRPFVVTGCARSGTTYMATVLAGLGLRIGHEAVFGPRTRSFEGWGGRHGDASWLAAPFLGEVGDALVCHQVRHPLKVVRSLVGVRFFADRGAAFLHGDDAYTRVKWRVRERLMAAGHVERSEHGARPHKLYRAYLRTYAPEVWAYPTEPERALAYWLTWTRMVRDRATAANYRAYHVELLSADVIAETLHRVGLTVTPEHVALAMAKVPQDLNSRRVASLAWSDLPDTPLRREAEGYAVELGYTPSDPSVLPGGLAQ